MNGELIQMKNNRAGESVPANEKQVQRIRSRLAMVFQGFNLWSHLTVLENVIEPINQLGTDSTRLGFCNSKTMLFCTSVNLIWL